jgi:hypothetical protein
VDLRPREVFARDVAAARVRDLEEARAEEVHAEADPVPLDDGDGGRVLEGERVADDGARPLLLPVSLVGRAEEEAHELLGVDRDGARELDLVGQEAAAHVERPLGVEVPPRRVDAVAQGELDPLEVEPDPDRSEEGVHEARGRVFDQRGLQARALVLGAEGRFDVGPEAEVTLEEADRRDSEERSGREDEAVDVRDVDLLADRPALGEHVLDGLELVAGTVQELARPVERRDLGEAHGLVGDERVLEPEDAGLVVTHVGPRDREARDEERRGDQQPARSHRARLFLGAPGV